MVGQGGSWKLWGSTVAGACFEPFLILIESRGAARWLIRLASPYRSTRFAAQLRVDNLVDHRVEFVFREVRAKWLEPSSNLSIEQITPGFVRVFSQVNSPSLLTKCLQDLAHPAELAVIHCD